MANTWTILPAPEMMWTWLIICIVLFVAFIFPTLRDWWAVSKNPRGPVQGYDDAPLPTLDGWAESDRLEKSKKNPRPTAEYHMGYYINKINGEWLPAKGKAEAMLNQIEGSKEIFGSPTHWQENLVCVVENPTFDAAGYCYNQAELDAFLYYPDPRPRRWLYVPGAAQLSEFTGELERGIS